jgi:hypothetical protein
MYIMIVVIRAHRGLPAGAPGHGRVAENGRESDERKPE